MTAITTDMLLAQAKALGVPPGMLCSTCGRYADTAEHFGHVVKRIPPQRLPRKAAVQWLTVAEVAAALHVSKMTVYRMVERRELTGHRIGRSIRVQASALTDYLEASVIGAESDTEETVAERKAELIARTRWGA